MSQPIPAESGDALVATLGRCAAEKVEAIVEALKRLGVKRNTPAASLPNIHRIATEAQVVSPTVKRYLTLAQSRLPYKPPPPPLAALFQDPRRFARFEFAAREQMARRGPAANRDCDDQADETNPPERRASAS